MTKSLRRVIWLFAGLIGGAGIYLVIALWLNGDSDGLSLPKPVGREADIKRPVWPDFPDSEEKKRERSGLAIDRFFFVMDVAKEFGLSKQHVVSTLGNPSGRFRNRFPVEEGDPKEGWLYAMDRKLEIVIYFDSSGKSAGFSSTGVRDYLDELFNGVER